MSLLSVLIPTYNRPTQLRQALESLKYLGPDIEVVIGNNGDHQLVCQILDEFQPGSNLRLLQNKAGSTYPENLKTLVNSAYGEWLTILHDDDFFTREAVAILPLLGSSNDLDFIFSDHYIALENGVISLELSESNSSHYGRASLDSGPAPNVQLLFVNNSIAMDCFFVRTRLAQACTFNVSLNYFADLFFVAQIVLRADKKSYYDSKRLFAYRVNEGLTSAGLLQDELLAVLQRIRELFDDPEAYVALQKRIRRQAWYSLKHSLKKLKFESAFAALSELTIIQKQ